MTNDNTPEPTTEDADTQSNTVKHWGLPSPTRALRTLRNRLRP